MDMERMIQEAYDNGYLRGYKQGKTEMYEHMKNRLDDEYDAGYCTGKAERVQGDDLIRRSDAIKAVKRISENYGDKGKRDYHPHIDFIVDELMYAVPSAGRPQGEWIDCEEPPSTDKNVFIAYGTDNMKSVCIGHYEHDMKLWYEDKNFFAKPRYDAMYWCEIPQFPTRMKGADDE